MASAECSKLWREKNKEKCKAYSKSDKRRKSRLVYSKSDKGRKNRQKWNKKVRSQRRAILNDIKLQMGCQNPHCQWGGSFEGYDLDFHHIDPTKKDKSIALMLLSNRVMEEIEKCTVLCAICHRRATYGKLDCSDFKCCG